MIDIDQRIKLNGEYYSREDIYGIAAINGNLRISKADNTGINLKNIDESTINEIKEWFHD